MTTKQKPAPRALTSSDNAEMLHKQCARGPVQLAGTENALFSWPWPETSCLDEISSLRASHVTHENQTRHGQNQT
jgi:hypothetical protein